MASTLVKRSLPRNSSVAVIGAGISGLSFTYFLSKLRPDLRFKVFEKTSRHGGYINTVIEKGASDDGAVGAALKYEKGPRTLRGVSDGTLVMLDLLLKAGLKDEIYAIYKKSAGNEKYLLSKHKNSDDDYLVKVPNDWKSFLRFLMSPLSKGVIPAVLGEPFRKLDKSGKDETISSFISRRFNEHLDANVVSAVIHGIYAGDTKELSVKALMPQLQAIEGQSSIVKSMATNAMKQIREKREAKNRAKQAALKEQEEEIVEISDDLIEYQNNFDKPKIHFSNMKKFCQNFPMIVFKNKGLGVITDYLYGELENNSQVEMNFTEDVSIEVSDDKIFVNNEKFDHVRSTISAKELSRTLRPTEETEKLIELLSQIQFVDMIVVNAFVHNTRLFKEGFGYLVPQSVSPAKHHLLGCIFDSSVEKNAVPLFGNNRHLVKLINYPNLRQDEINSMISLKDDTNKKEDLVKMTFMFGGHYLKQSNHDATDLWNLSENQMKKMIQGLIGEQFHLPQEQVEKLVITKIKDCIPQYTVGYLELKASIVNELQEHRTGRVNDELLSVGGMSLNHYNKIGVPDVFMDSLKQAILFK